MTSFDYHLNPLYPIKECLSCGALYTTDYCCSEGTLGDKIICDLDKTLDLSQRSPQNCPKCGHLVDGHYCQGCALLRKKFKEDLFTLCIENEILQDSSRPSNDNTNVANAPREPFVVNQDPGKNPSQNPPQSNQHCYYVCGDPLEDIFCHQCTYELCGNGAHYGYNCLPKVPIIPDPEPFNNQIIKEFPPTVQSFDPKSDLVYDSPNVFDPPPQPPFYSCEFCRSVAHYGHYCTPKEEEKQIEEEQAAKTRYWKIPACYDDDDNDYTIAITHKEPDNSLSMRDEHLDTILATESNEFIKSSVENLVPNPSESKGEHEYDVPVCDDFTTFSNLLFDANDDFSFKSLLNQDSLIFSSSLNIYYLLDEFADELILLKPIPSGIDKANCDPEEEIRLIEKLLDKIICDLDKTLDLSERSPRIVLSVDTRLMVIIVKDVLFSERNLRKICLHIVLKMEFSKILPSHPMTIPTLLMLLESHSLLIKTLILACYDDDDDDYTFVITPNEPDNSLSMGDENLDIIPATESDEFIMSSVENLVSNRSESEGKLECDVPACEIFTTFSNILFDADYNFSSSDDQSFFGEDFPKEIYSNPLFDEEIISIKIDPHHFNVESDLIESLRNHDSSIISFPSKINSLFDEFAGELTLLKSIPPGINETYCDPEEETRFIKRLLYDNSSLRPPEEFVSENSNVATESFSPSLIPVEDSDSLIEEIDLSFTPDYPMPSAIEDDDYDSERDILILEELLSNNSLLLLENESFHFDIPLFSRPPAKPPDGNTGILNVKVMGDISEQKFPMPRLMITLIPNQEKSPDLLSHLGHEDF
nr:hypothetical protein [Tanacetum cinerariifolium]